jgi:DNA polymerase III subunit gamma/tau
VLEGRSVDIIEIDGASNNSVDDIRKLRENAKYPPSHGKYKMYVIDEVHMLSSAAFNALLKTLEEPPPHLMFVFATTESHKVLPTITSRCQRYDFRRMETPEIVSRLKYIAERENVVIDEKSLMLIAKRADGSMRDSQSIFDQVIAFCGKNVDFHATVDSLSLIDDEFYFRISKAALNKDTAEMFLIANEILNKGYDLQETLSGLLEHYRNLLTIVVTKSTELIEAATEIKQLYQEEASKYGRNDLIRLMNLVANAENEIRFAKQPRVKFELTLCKLASMDTIADIEELLAEIKKLQGTETEAYYDKKESKKVSTHPQVKENTISYDKAPDIKNTPHIAKVQAVVPLQKYELPRDWEKVVNSQAMSDKGFSKALTNAKVEIFNKTLTLTFDNDFHYQHIKSQVKAFESFLYKEFDLELKIEAILDKPVIEQGSENSSTSISSQSISETKGELKPIELSLISEFGAIETKND